MADKKNIKQIRDLLSKNKITMQELRAIVQSGKGVSKRRDSIIKQYQSLPGDSSSGSKRKRTPLKDKQNITPKDVQTFKKFYNLNESGFQRILQGNPQNDFENRVYADAKKIFTPDKMKKLPKAANKDHPAVQSYMKARDATSGSEYTQEQQDINEQLLKYLKGENVSDKDQETQSPVEKEVAGLLGKAGIPEGAREAIAENLPSVIQAYQQSGYEQRPQYGDYTNNRLLQSYDSLVNRLRPKESGVSQFARKYRPLTNLAGSIGGKAGGAALGALVGNPALGGMAGGALGGLTTNFATNYLTQEQPEFKGLADRLRGGDAGYFSRGKRGLADIIAGTEGKQGKLDRSLDVFGRFVTGGDPFNWFNTEKEPLTRFQKLRRKVASPVRGLGNLLGSPNAANNIRLGLQGLQGLYDIGNATGINDWLSSKLGFKQGPQYAHTGFETGEQLANPVITGAIDQALPFLQEQTSRILGRNVTGQEMIGDLDARLRDVLTPQIMQRDIQRANEDINRRRIQQRINIERANQQARQAERLLQQQQQDQNFRNRAQVNQQQAVEARLNADIAVRANKLAANQAALRQKITPQAPLRRVVQQPTQLWDVAEGVGNVINPIAGRYIAEGFPIAVDPVVKGK